MKFKMGRVVFFVTIITAILIGGYAHSNNMLDEFSSIHHSDVIIEAGMSLDQYGHPTQSYHAKTIKGDDEDVSEVLSRFGISKKKGKIKITQKRIMFFYKNNRGEWRSMNLIRDGIGPYSDEITYKDFVKLVKVVNKKLNGEDSKNGVIVLKDSSLCSALYKNKYFIEKYKIKSEKFTAGGKAGAFREFSPLVKINCQ